jgi:hypothetical protein
MPTETFKRVAASALELTPEAMAILRERWSNISSEEGTEECVCSWCGKMIGRDERDPAWEDHIQYCVGCEVCEIAIRVWKDHPEKKGLALELRFHPNCVNEVRELTLRAVVKKYLARKRPSLPTSPVAPAGSLVGVQILARRDTWFPKDLTFAVSGAPLFGASALERAVRPERSDSRYQRQAQQGQNGYIDSDVEPNAKICGEQTLNGEPNE